MIRNRPVGLTNLPATIHESYDPREICSGIAYCDTRELRSARSMTRNRLLGVINLPAMTHAIFHLLEI